MPSLVSYFFSCKYWLKCSPYKALPKSPRQRCVLPLPPERNSKAALTTLYYTNYLYNYSLDYKLWQAEAIHLGIPSAWHSPQHIKDSKLPFLTWTNYKIKKKMSLRVEKKKIKDHLSCLLSFFYKKSRSTEVKNNLPVRSRIWISVPI